MFVFFSLLIYHFSSCFSLSSLHFFDYPFLYNSVFLCKCISLHLFYFDSSNTYFLATRLLFFSLPSLTAIYDMTWHCVRRNELSTKITGEDRRELMELQYQVRHLISSSLTSSLLSPHVFSFFPFHSVPFFSLSILMYTYKYIKRRLSE